MSVPLQPRDDGCAVVERVATTDNQWGSTCLRPPAVRARWQSRDSSGSLLLCDQHASDLAADKRLSDVVRLDDAAAEDGPVGVE